jgi:hypothetical protein
MDDYSSYSRRSRIPVEEPLPFYSKFEESLKAPMKPIIDAHDSLKYTYNSLDELIGEVVSQNDWLLNSKVYTGRYISRLKQEEEKLQHLRDQLEKDYYKIENNPDIFKLDNEIKSYTAQAETLSRFSFQLKAQKDQYRQRFNAERDYVLELKEKLKEITKENLKISYDIEETKSKPLESMISKSKLPSLNSKYSATHISSQLPIKFELLNDQQRNECYESLDSLQKIKKEIKDIKEASQQLSSLQGSFLSEQKKLEEFFQECLETAKQKLIQNQQMPQINKKGLAGSLFFDLIQNEKSNQGLGIINEKTHRSAFQDRDSKNILYYTVKRMIKTARNDQRKQQISNIQLTIQDFNSFTSLQILGLICLRNDIQVELHYGVFPANLLHIQYNNAKQIKKSKSIKKPKINNPTLTG